MSAVATAIVGGTVVGGYLTSQATTSAAQTAATAQTEAAGTASAAELEATKLAVEEQRRQFDEMKTTLAPYVSAGETALTSQMALAGLGGVEAQQTAITNIESSPIFQAQVKAGEEALLQQASATGGLRGGNVQAALAKYRPAMLQAEIENQYAKLGGITGIGQASAAGQAAAGQAAAGNISNLYAQQGTTLANLAQSVGAANAGSALAAGQAQAQMYSGITNTATQLGTLKLLGAF